MSIPSASSSEMHALVVQHNALVNARFDLNTLETRLFLALLARCSRQDTTFAKCQVGVREIMTQTGSHRRYEQLRKMVKDFGGRTLLIEELGADGRPEKDPNFVVIPLLAYAKYMRGEGIIEARFNDLLLPYLVELRDNFTKAQLTELLKLKSAFSYRIYWLLREYAAFGKRTIALDELKAILGLDQEYDRFDNFRARVLDRAKAELDATDLPFTYEAIKQGRAVTEIRFNFPPGGVVTLPPATAQLLAWEKALLAVGIANASLPAIRARLAGGDYDEGYVHYVLAQVAEKVKAGKVKKEGGAVFKALTDCYMLPAYQKAKQTPSSFSSKASSTLAKRHKKLLSELEDACNSLQFVKTATIYSDLTRPVAVDAVQQTIAQLEEQLAELNKES